MNDQRQGLLPDRRMDGHIRPAGDLDPPEFLIRFERDPLWSRKGRPYGSHGGSKISSIMRILRSRYLGSKDWICRRFGHLPGNPCYMAPWICERCGQDLR